MRHHILLFPFCVDVQYIPISFFLKTSLKVNLHPVAGKNIWFPVRTDYAISVIATYGSPFPFAFFYQLFHLIKRRQPPFSFPFTTRNIQFSSGNIGWSIWFQIFFSPKFMPMESPYGNKFPNI